MLHVPSTEFAKSCMLEISQAAGMHYDLSFLCKLIRGIWRKSSEERKKDHSWLFAIFLTLFARGRGYGCAVYPSHGAKQQCRSSTPSSKQAWHEKPSKDIWLWEAQVKNNATTNTVTGGKASRHFLNYSLELLSRSSPDSGPVSLELPSQFSPVFCAYPGKTLH